MFEDYVRQHGLNMDVVPESQTSDYESGVVTMEGASWHIRTARNTPTKPGAFVAFWRRDKSGETAPFNADEVAAGLMVFVASNQQRKHAGKSWFRVYPAWSTDLNPQAAATQRAQMAAFSQF